MSISKKNINKSSSRTFSTSNMRLLKSPILRERERGVGMNNEENLKTTLN